MFPKKQPSHKDVDIAEKGQNTLSNNGAVASPGESQNPLFSLSETQLRSLCRRQIETMEHWSRRLITDTFTEAYGKEYWNETLNDGQPLVKSETRSRVNRRLDSDSNRYPRWIDAVLLDDIKYFFCRDELYKDHFKPIFEPFYSGASELRSVLSRLVEIRNKLSHSNAISIHEAEQALCYTNDIITCFKSHYVRIGKGRRYNVPFFTHIKDSLGNEFIREDPEHIWEITHKPSSERFEKIELRSGDTYKLWAEIDGAYAEDSYSTRWTLVCGNRKEHGHGCDVEITLNNSDVSNPLQVYFYLTTNNSWHKHAITFDRSLDYDDQIEWTANGIILPPIESTY